MNMQGFALVIGLVYFALGALGFIPAALTPPDGDGPRIHLLGVFPVNALLSVVHLALGLWGVLAARGGAHPRVFLFAAAAICATLAVFGLTPGFRSLFGLAPLHGAGVWLHAATALLAAWAILAHEPIPAVRRDHERPI